MNQVNRLAQSGVQSINQAVTNALYGPEIRTYELEKFTLVQKRRQSTILVDKQCFYNQSKVLKNSSSFSFPNVLHCYMFFGVQKNRDICIYHGDEAPTMIYGKDTAMVLGMYDTSLVLGNDESQAIQSCLIANFEKHAQEHSIGFTTHNVSREACFEWCHDTQVLSCFE